VSLSPTQATDGTALENHKGIAWKRPIALALSVAAFGLIGAGPASAATPSPPCPGGLDTALSSPGIDYPSGGPALTNHGVAQNGGAYNNQATNACT
jgi:hypothetical protein